MKKKEVEKKVKKIVKLSLRLNGLERKSAIEERPTVFLDFSGHVSLITVKIYPNGWDRDKESFSMEAYLDKRGTLENLDKIIAWLEEMGKTYQPAS